MEPGQLLYLNKMGGANALANSMHNHGNVYDIIII